MCKIAKFSRAAFFFYLRSVLEFGFEHTIIKHDLLGYSPVLIRRTFHHRVPFPFYYELITSLRGGFFVTRLGEVFFCFSQIRQPHTRDQRPKKKSSRAQS